MDRKQTLIVNLVAGPCSGKSTNSAELFARLKRMNISCEYVPEFIKEEIYKENLTLPKNQLPLFGAEVYSLDNKIGKVDVIVHDGSLINNIIYDYENDTEFHKFVAYWFNKYENLNFFIKRGDIEFETYGRLHNESEAKALDNRIKETHDKFGISYHEISSKDAVDKMIPVILEKMKALNKMSRYVIAEAYNQTYHLIRREAYRILSNQKIGTPTLYVIDCETMKKYVDYPNVTFYRMPSSCKSVDQLKDMYDDGLLEPEELEKI